MAYEMHEWVCNEPITADKLNHMEQGIVEAQNDESSDVLIIRQDEEATTSTKMVFDKTWQEVFDALRNGTRVFGINETEIPPTVIVAPVLVATNDTSNQIAPYHVLGVEVTNATVGSGVMYADTADDYLYVNLGGNNA